MASKVLNLDWHRLKMIEVVCKINSEALRPGHPKDCYTKQVKNEIGFRSSKEPCWDGFFHSPHLGKSSQLHTASQLGRPCQAGTRIQDVNDLIRDFNLPRKIVVNGKWGSFMIFLMIISSL
jgi:hypothetical protein